MNRIFFNYSAAILTICCALTLIACEQITQQSPTTGEVNKTLTANVQFYVSEQGKKGNNGSKETPFKSIKAARDAIRALNKNQREQDIIVWLRGGKHLLSETLVLNRQDGGQGKAFVQYRAYEGEIPVISSGKEVTGWRKLTTPVKGLPEQAIGKIWVADVSRAEFGRFTAIFTGDKRLPRAKSLRFGGEKPTGYKIADSRNVMYKKDRQLLRQIRYKQGVPIRQWSNLDDIEVFFNPVPWALNFIPLESIDMEKRLLTLQFEANAPAFSQNKPYAWLENAVDFIDEAGEWAHNSETGKLYYWPYDNAKPENITIPQLKELVRVEGEIDYAGPSDNPVKNISFEGLTFTQAKRSSWTKDRKGWGIQHDWDTFDTGNAMLRFRGAENIKVIGNHFTNTAGSAIRLDLHAQQIEIKNNLIDYVGHMGILLAGYGPGTKDVNHHNTIANNIIHHVGEIIWHGHAIFVWQSGSNLITNNWIHDVPRKAIGICGVRAQILMKFNEDFDEAAQTIRWNEIDKNVTWNDDLQKHFVPYLHAKNNIIEKNKVTNTLLQLKDGASINVSGAGEGNIIRHNYVYDVDIAFRTDDWQRGTTTTNNIVNGARIAVIHKDYNHITNNIFMNYTGEAILMRAFPRQYFKLGSVIQQNIFISNAEKSKPYKARDLWDSDQFYVVKGGNKAIPYEYELNNNIYSFPRAEKFLQHHQKYGVESNSIIIDTDANDIDIDILADLLKRNGLISSTGFKPFEMAKSAFGITKNFPERLRKLDRRTKQWGGTTVLNNNLAVQVGNH